ncbi:hypothetical protein [Streptomyces rimosus]|uniref:Uncharacterized protein n=2 Tax=Streptomyces rimosus subsp. rimosus TaxID=132474 RepID=L8EXI4_STRR1|nr:hypothetical protein [Streptomyces rimosus]KOG71153.1 hypothetical protein ADK78_25690 [Kitasatospora aureofaciens]KOT33904.1 hypothetical protein ADK84_25190 [Streptomyces sp. NRRL WC-3701]MYT47919.1 hypothetical protein [Streptomyces sp. SID5471]KOT34480.1 hypothetical protein ADK42_22200 [Streptomyces rimosus subsp. rimosus]KOT57332.1 hypothetical protein ADK44_21610 [Streptomyces rimosus subsp. rimosus]
MTYMERLRQQLLAQARPRDHWDRPGGDWGGHPRQPPSLVSPLRSGANSHYRIGSRALHRGETETAESLFHCALSDAGHPGAAFRVLAAAARRSTAAHQQGRGHLLGMRAAVRYLQRAAAWGHGDARQLLDWISSSPAGPARPEDGEAQDAATGYTPQDPDFYPEIRLFLYCLMGARPAAPARCTTNSAPSSS